MEKVYSYDELASILGCSRTAIAKKVKPDTHNPGVERYKNRYEVVIKDGKKGIKLTDEALEEEKLKSKGFKNVSNESVDTSQNTTNSEIEPKKQDKKEDETQDVTERYMDKFLIMQQHMYNQLHDRDKQILLLTVNEKQKEEAYNQTQAKNTELTQKYNIIEKKYKIAKNVIYCFITFSLIFTTFQITIRLNNNNVSNDLNNVSANVSNVQESVINDKKPAEVQEVVKPQAPQQAKNANVQQKRK